MISLVKGFLIGIANIIPGVSGGTFALVLGLFDRLIEALKNLDAAALRAGLRLVTHRGSRAARAELRLAWQRVDGTFLVLLGAGAALAITSCAWAFDFLLREHPGETLAFFVGLIIPSLAVPWRMMEDRGARTLVWVLPGAAVTVGLSLADIGSQGADPGLGLVFGGGVLAVSAMVLPGVSGSFLLLVLGLYQPLLTHIKALTRLHTGSLAFLATFGFGMVVGLVGFSHVMSFLLRRCRSATLAFLIGLILGSFWVLWPIKDFASGARVTDSRGRVKRDIAVATAVNRLPGPDDGCLCLRAGAALGVGLVGALGIDHLGRRR